MSGKEKAKPASKGVSHADDGFAVNLMQFHRQPARFR